VPTSLHLHIVACEADSGEKYEELPIAEDNGKIEHLAVGNDREIF